MASLRRCPRKACYEGLTKIGDFVTENGFVELVKVRNRMAKTLGFLDFYDYKVTNAEGFGKIALFEILDTLEKGTRPILEEARKRFADENGGADALEPWNLGFLMAGDVTRRMDPYFPFEKSGQCIIILSTQSWSTVHVRLISSCILISCPLHFTSQSSNGVDPSQP